LADTPSKDSSSNDQPTPEAMAETAIKAANDAVEQIRAQADSAAPLKLPDFAKSSGDGSDSAGMDLLSDVNLHVKVELGRTRMLIEDILRLNTDSVIELDKAAGDPVDIYINGRHIARGEVLVLNENFCVRISEIIQSAEVLPKAG
jgi:flagellar motor switch protein FliN